MIANDFLNARCDLYYVCRIWGDLFQVCNYLLPSVDDYVTVNYDSRYGTYTIASKDFTYSSDDRMNLWPLLESWMLDFNNPDYQK